MAVGPTEQDYFSELPEVLTVTRLAQPLAETPGAVTIIDRETIRRSGARELADVLRLVPGYMVGGWNGANPGVAYHAPLDDYGTRNLIQIDGRSVYSSFYLGDTYRGLMTVLVDDIERIEVLRGANSAAYGANAMFGVINIVTRHTVDTHGVEVSVTGGDGGTGDSYGRVGWGDAAASFRLTTGRRQDSGYTNAYDDKIVSQLHFRGDLQPSADSDAMIAAGASQLALGEGFPGEAGNPERTIVRRAMYLQGQWRYRPAPAEEFKLSASYDEEFNRDSAVYAPDPTVTLDFGGRGRRLNLELQHQFGISPALRAVWGAGYKYEDAQSAPLFYTGDNVSIHETRVFGNLEWRPHPDWLINAGGFWGDHSRKGAYFLPRLMANYHVTPDHTLRIGTTESKRMPSLYELYADRRYYPVATAPLPLRYDAATGNVSPETLKSDELGYFGNFRDWHLTLDVRAYRERMFGIIGTQEYWLPGYALRKVNDYVNVRDLEARGVEYQLRWKPLEDTEIWLNQSAETYRYPDGDNHRLPPDNMATVAIFQKLPQQFDLSLMFYQSGSMTWRDQARKLPGLHRLDVRLAKPFRVGATRAEAALTIQAANGGYMASYPDSTQPPMIQERRTFGTLRLEF